MVDETPAELVAAIRAVSDTAAARRLAEDAWAAPDRPLALRAVLSGVRAYAGHEARLRPTFEAAPPGEVRGACERPAYTPCWWLGTDPALKTKTKPLMGFADVGERLPEAARYWTVSGLGYWWRVPKGG